jgi:hypothetical protein
MPTDAPPEAAAPVDVPAVEVRCGLSVCLSVCALFPVQLLLDDKQRTCCCGIFPTRTVDMLLRGC